MCLDKIETDQLPLGQAMSVEEQRLLLTTLVAAHESFPEGPFVELGTNRALSAQAIVGALAQLNGKRMTFYSVDIRELPARDYWDKGVIPLLADAASGLVVHLVISSSWEFASQFQAHTVPWVFVDACHCYQCVCKDLEAWVPKICPGGFLICHDVGFKENLNCNIQHPPGLRYGVLRAIMDCEELLSPFGFYGVVHSSPLTDNPGMMAFQRKTKEGP
jgi:hypothetical protein